MTQTFQLTECHKDLIVSSAGNEQLLTGLLFNTWVTTPIEIYDLMEAATGKKEFYTQEFETAASFLLNHQI